MEMRDAIIVGASNSGFMAGLELLEKGYRVLVLEEHNNIGVTSKTIRHGRFEFENSTFGYYLGDNDREYSLAGLLDKVHVPNEVFFLPLEHFYTVISSDEKYTMPFGIEEFVNQMEEYVPGSRESMSTFFELASICCDAMEYIVSHIGEELSYDYLKENYNPFIRVAPYSVSKVLDNIEMPIKAQEILNACWIYFGSSEADLSFVEYAMFLYNAICYGLSVPVNRNYDITLALSQAFLEKGGELKLNSKVERILVEENKVNGVKLVDNTIYYSDTVIVSSLESKVYSSLIEPSSLPRNAIKSLNARELGPSLFTVHLGLNCSASELGLEEYSYLIYDSLDSDMLVSRLDSVYNSNQFVTVENVVNSDVSPNGTCILNLTSLIRGNVFDDYVDHDNYMMYEEEEALKIIETFEYATHTKIKEHIEEIRIITPVEYSYFNKEYYGSMFGYRAHDYENLVPRILNYKNELYIDGLFLCGGFNGDVFGYHSDIVSGYIAGKVATQRMEGRHE